MSHVVDVKVRIKDLAACKRTCDALKTLEFVENVRHYKWYGHHVGDYPMPAGFTKADLGKCDHIIRVKGGGPQTYEIGVVKAKDGDGYTLIYDFYAGGHGLVQALTGEMYQYTTHDPTKDLDRFMQEYTLQTAEYQPEVQQLVAQGWQVAREVQPDQDVHLVITR